MMMMATCVSQLLLSSVHDVGVTGPQFHHERLANPPVYPGHVVDLLRHEQYSITPRQRVYYWGAVVVCDKVAPDFVAWFGEQRCQRERRATIAMRRVDQTTSSNDCVQFNAPHLCHMRGTQAEASKVWHLHGIVDAGHA